MKTENHPKVGGGGFSLVQVLAVIAIGGSLTAFAVSVHSDLGAVGAEEQLRSDVRMINIARGQYQLDRVRFDAINPTFLVLGKAHSGSPPG